MRPPADEGKLVHQGSIETELRGGPLDGRRLAIPTFDQLDPPVEFHAAAPDARVSTGPGGPVKVTVLVYERSLNLGDAGPLWFYDFARAEDGHG
jgi:hypothetical protein